MNIGIDSTYTLTVRDSEILARFGPGPVAIEFGGSQSAIQASRIVATSAGGIGVRKSSGTGTIRITGTDILSGGATINGVTGASSVRVTASQLRGGAVAGGGAMSRDEAFAVLGLKAGADPNDKNIMKGLNTLTISVYPNKSGNIGTMAVGEAAMGNSPAALDNRLRSVLTDTASPFEQVIIQVGSGLRYDALMSVVDVCTRQKLADGKQLSKLSFVELPDGSE